MAGGKLKRKQDWPILLSAYLNDRAGMPFVRGKNDCMIFCADCILELTGTDPAPELRNYKTKKGADKIIKSFGKSIEDIITSKLGEPKPITKAMRGDIVLFNHNGDPCGGVVDESAKNAAFVTENGLCRIPLKNCLKAWGY